MCISSGKRISDQPMVTSPRLASSQTNNRAQVEDPSSVIVPTFREERPRSVDVPSLSQSELAKLKVEDPFMYYSIPSVRIAELSGNAVGASSAGTGTVVRMQRVTAELYPDILVEGIVNNANSMERIVQEVQEEMEQEQQDAQEDEEEEEEEEEEEGGANDDMIQQYFKLLSEEF
ncbi:hypothetical protein ACHAWO_007923 [Cyclotella atomus]|uniref:Uncharacterized protein n=1 Tax=Cyclotella atomus TaxID=382360 RepID=A0ABD3MM31_9STRA